MKLQSKQNQTGLSLIQLTILKYFCQNGKEEKPIEKVQMQRLIKTSLKYISDIERLNLIPLELMFVHVKMLKVL